MLWSGNFADVYKIHCPATGNTWALKCFTRQVHGQQERYRRIAAHLELAKLPFTVDFQYQERGIRLHGEKFPVLKMRWVEGQMLNQFVEEHVERPVNLKMILELWLKLAARLREARIAHADLQHGNVILVPLSGGSLALRLIDYDGMYVPSLVGTRSGEVGLPAYQHPQRIREGTYNAEVDRFSHLVIYTAIRCLTVGRGQLWQRFNTGENLLFRDSDFCHPEQSELFRVLWRIEDPLAQAMVGRLILACRRPAEESPLLQDIVAADGRALPLSRDDYLAVEAIMGTEAAPAELHRHPTMLDAEAILGAGAGVAQPVPQPARSSSQEQPSGQGLLAFLDSENAPIVTRNRSFARARNAVRRPTAFLDSYGRLKFRFLNGGLALLATLLALLIWAAIPGRNSGIVVQTSASAPTVDELVRIRPSKPPTKLPGGNNRVPEKQPSVAADSKPAETPAIGDRSTTSADEQTRLAGEIGTAVTNALNSFSNWQETQHGEWKVENGWFIGSGVAGVKFKKELPSNNYILEFKMNVIEGNRPRVSVRSDVLAINSFGYGNSGWLCIQENGHFQYPRGQVMQVRIVCRDAIFQLFINGTLVGEAKTDNGKHEPHLELSTGDDGGNPGKVAWSDFRLTPIGKSGPPFTVADDHPGSKPLLQEGKVAPEQVVAPLDVENAKVRQNDVPSEEPVPEQSLAKKIEPPAAAEQARLAQTLDNNFKLAEAKDWVAKAAIARQLLENGRTHEANRAEQYVLLRRASEIAADAGETDIVLEAVDAMSAAGFNIEPLAAKARLLKQLVTQSPRAGVSQVADVSAACAKFAEQAVASDAVGDAVSVIDAVGPAVRAAASKARAAYASARVKANRARNTNFAAAREEAAQDAQADLEAIEAAQSALTELATNVQQAAREHEALPSALEQLKANPNDANACLAVGRWYCFRKDDWDSGLKLLAKGSDNDLKSLAAKELSSTPANADDWVVRGDAWWDYAEKAGAGNKSAARRRAKYWYERAVIRLSGFTRDMLEKRLRMLEEVARPARDNPSNWSDVLSHMDVEQDRVIGNWRATGTEITTEALSHGASRIMLPVKIEGGFDLSLQFTRFGGNNAIVIVIPVGTTWCLVVFHSLAVPTGQHGIQLIDGQSTNSTTIRPGTLIDGHKYDVLICVRAKGETASIEVVLDKKQRFWWSGKQSSLTGLENWKSPDPKRPCIGAFSSRASFEAVKIRAVSGGKISFVR